MSNLSELSVLQQQLLGKLVGLARAYYAEEAYADTNHIMLLSLQECLITEHSSIPRLQSILEQLKETKALLTPNCAMCNMCNRTHDYDIKQFGNSEEDVQHIKLLLLFSLHTLAHFVSVQEDKNSYEIFYKGLFAFGEDWSVEYLTPIIKEIGQLLLVEFTQQYDELPSYSSYDTPKSIAILLAQSIEAQADCMSKIHADTLQHIANRVLLCLS